MVMNFSDCCEKYGGRYRTDKLIRMGELHKVAPGLYSDKAEWSDIEVMLARYPRAVVTLQSAYYYYDLSDSIPDVFHLATHERILNASVEVNNYEPVTFDELVENNRRHKENYLRGQKTEDKRQRIETDDGKH